MADLLRKGDLGIDYSLYRLNPPNAAVAQGAKFVLRYSAGIASRPSHPSYPLNKPKLITPGEYAGLDPHYVMLANSEWYEGRITEGDAAGFADGQADFELWHACGYPKGYPVFCSWDAYPAASSFAGVAAYLRGHQRGLDTAAGGRYYLTDLYAGENGIRAMQGQGLAPIGWRTMAGSWNDYIPAAQTHAAIVQTGNYWFGQQCDENQMARDLALGGGDDMPLTDDDIARIWAYGPTGGAPASQFLIDAKNAATSANNRAAANSTKLDGLSVDVAAIPTQPIDQVALERAIMDSIALALAGGVPVDTIEQGVTNALAGASIPVNLTGHAGTPPVTP